MIELVKEGNYQLVVTKDKYKLLTLGDEKYVWVYAKGIGELLLYPKHIHKPHYILAQGVFKIYKVKDEPNYVDLLHLELSVGGKEETWQGYLLLTGFPTTKKVRRKFIPTNEVISNKIKNNGKNKN